MANGGFGVWFECGPPLTKPGSKAVGSDTKLEDVGKLGTSKCEKKCHYGEFLWGLSA